MIEVLLVLRNEHGSEYYLTPGEAETLVTELRKALIPLEVCNSCGENENDGCDSIWWGCGSLWHNVRCRV